MGVNRNMTPRKFRPVWTSKTLWRPHLVTNAGTFNSLAYLGAANSSVLESRWWFCGYISSGTAANSRRAGQYSFHVPYDYIDETDVKIRVYWTSAEVDGGSETVTWEVGLTQENSGVIGDDTGTEYLSTDEALTSSAGEFPAMQSAVLTFNGAGIFNGDKSSIIVSRQGSVDSADSTAYTLAVEFIYQRESVEQESGVINRKMTPTEFTPEFREVCYTSYEAESQPGTFSSLVTTSSSLAVLDDRWTSYDMPDALEENLSFNWIVPPDYKTGSDITIRLKYYGSTSSTNSVWTFMGMCTDTMGNTFGNDTDTEYPAPTGGSPTAMSGTAYSEEELEWVFSGINQSSTEIAPGDAVSFVLCRQGTAGSDNYTGNFRPMNFNIKYQADKEGALTI